MLGRRFRSSAVLVPARIFATCTGWIEISRCFLGNSSLPGSGLEQSPCDGIGNRKWSLKGDSLSAFLADNQSDIVESDAPTEEVDRTEFERRDFSVDIASCEIENIFPAVDTQPLEPAIQLS